MPRNPPISARRLRVVTLSGVVAAAYIALVLSNLMLSYGVFQFRIAEVLTVLPFLFPETIPGLFVGCLLSNFFSTVGPLDIVVGSVATLLAAILTSKCKVRWLAPLPPILINAVLIGGLITFYVPGVNPFNESVAVPLIAAVGLNALSVGVGELVVCAGLGIPFLILLEKLDLKKRIRQNN